MFSKGDVMLSRPIALWSLAFIVTGVASMSWSRAESEAPGRVDSGLVEAARLTLQGMQEHFKTGHSTAEDVYRWSKRTADAEHAAGIGSAYIDHLKRMQSLKSFLSLASEQGRISDFEVAAANYYVAEATPLAVP